MSKKIITDTMNYFIKSLGITGQTVKAIRLLDSYSFENGEWETKNNILELDVVFEDGKITFVDDIEKYTGMTIITNLVS